MIYEKLDEVNPCFRCLHVHCLLIDRRVLMICTETPLAREDFKVFLRRNTEQVSGKQILFPLPRNTRITLIPRENLRYLILLVKHRVELLCAGTPTHGIGNIAQFLEIGEHIKNPHISRTLCHRLYHH